MRRKKERIIAIILSIAIVFCGVGANYKKASATGFAGAGILGASAINPATALIVLLGICGVGVAIEYGDDAIEAVQSAGAQALKDFESYALQAVENNQNATANEAQQNAQIHATIDDFMTSLEAGVIDVSSEAWTWLQGFINSVYETFNPEYIVNPHGTIEGFPVFGDGIYQILTKKASGGRTKVYEIMIEGSSLASECSMPILTANYSYDIIIRNYLTGKGIDATGTYKGRTVTTYADGSMEVEEWGSAETFTDTYYIDTFPFSGYQLAIPVWQGNIDESATISAPVGTTDIPGVANPGAYGLHGQDCLVTGNTGWWDLTDPLGVMNPVELGPDVPPGYDTWEQAIEAVDAGEISWPGIISGVDIVGVESNTTDIPGEGERTDVENWNVVIPGALPIPYPDAVDEAWQDTINDNVEEEVTETEVKYEEKVKPYILDFKDFFPFCIPFDIYHFFKLLSANPVAPVIHYKFYVNKTKYYTININLNKFNDVAEILRTMELLAFIVGLAFVTRSMFIRG